MYQFSACRVKFENVVGDTLSLRLREVCLLHSFFLLFMFECVKIFIC